MVSQQWPMTQPLVRKAPVAEFSSFQNWATLGLIYSAFFRITS